MAGKRKNKKQHSIHHPRFHHTDKENSHKAIKDYCQTKLSEFNNAANFNRCSWLPANINLLKGKKKCQNARACLASFT